MSVGIPRLCIRITGIFFSAAKEARRSSSSSAEMSFRMSAPASNAAFITSYFRVSTLIGMSDSFRIASITGTTRLISSSASTYSLPGLVDSPPMSSISAPSEISDIARSKPPRLSFQNESPFAFTIPMTNAGSSVSINLSAKEYFIFPPKNFP